MKLDNFGVGKKRGQASNLFHANHRSTCAMKHATYLHLVTAPARIKDRFAMAIMADESLQGPAWPITYRPLWTWCCIAKTAS